MENTTEHITAINGTFSIKLNSIRHVHFCILVKLVTVKYD